jgi:hypothetical protein
MERKLIYILAITEEMQDYNDYFAFTDLEEAQKTTKRLIKEVKEEASIFEIYHESEYEFYYNTSEGNQKIFLFETLTTDYKTFYNENN